MNVVRALLALLLCTLLAACVSQTISSTTVPNVNTASSPVPEDQLLDVGIAVFDPGLEDYDGQEGVYPEVRKAESRYMPTVLADAMQNSGAWGAVRVVPDPERLSDLVVKGKILHSDGEELELHVTAVDSRGYVWLDRDYSGNASHYAYEMTTRNRMDPFQAVYNTIANDLLAQQEKLKAQDRKNIRLVTELLFARSFAPDAFDGYLDKTRKGQYLVMRLPAENDPMLERIDAIRDRDQLYVDTLQEYYHNFNTQMYDPYQEWRKQSYEEAEALKELQAKAAGQLIAGGIAVLAGIAAATTGDSDTTRVAGQVAVIGGGYLLKSGLETRNESQIHVQALEELGQSLEAEITPQVIEVEDRTVTLTGNVEDQYAQWRSLLADIYRTEIGSLELPEDQAVAADQL